MPLSHTSYKRIIMLMPYFGHWPEWFPLYLESCRWNPTINWLFFTDCPIPANAPQNVQFVAISYLEYQQMISERLEINFDSKSFYKLCDLRPAYGFIHQDYLANYDYFGFGDIDVIYGDLRAFYTDDVLKHNAVSTHKDRVSAHFFLLKNEEKWINLFRKIPNWQNLMSHPEHQCMDEFHFTKLLRGHRLLPPELCKLWGLFDPYKRNNLFHERFSTVLAEWTWMDGTYNYPTRWYWLRGKLIAGEGQEMMYLHFMNWKSKRYLRSRYGQDAAWDALSQLVDPALIDLSQGWCISDKGFAPLPEEKKAALATFYTSSKSG